MKEEELKKVIETSGKKYSNEEKSIKRPTTPGKKVPDRLPKKDDK
ncbi:hypothetical protein [Carnobacterium pleistocenium]|nr:hypothetical protein [Carnobacterium pleistocenium]